jgi:hypothetical protein
MICGAGYLQPVNKHITIKIKPIPNEGLFQKFQNNRNTILLLTI